MDLKKLLGRVDYYNSLLADLEAIEKKYNSDPLAMMNWSAVFLPFSELKRELEFERDRVLFASQMQSEYQELFAGLSGDENKQ